MIPLVQLWVLITCVGVGSVVNRIYRNWRSQSQSFAILGLVFVLNILKKTSPQGRWSVFSCSWQHLKWSQNLHPLTNKHCYTSKYIWFEFLSHAFGKRLNLESINRERKSLPNILFFFLAECVLQRDLELSLALFSSFLSFCLSLSFFDVTQANKLWNLCSQKKK